MCIEPLYIGSPALRGVQTVAAFIQATQPLILHPACHGCLSMHQFNVQIRLFKRTSFCSTCLTWPSSTMFSESHFICETLWGVKFDDGQPIWLSILSPCVAWSPCLTFPLFGHVLWHVAMACRKVHTARFHDSKLWLYVASLSSDHGFYVRTCMQPQI